MTRRFHLLTGMFAIGTLLIAGCANEEAVSTTSTGEAPTIEQAKTNAVTPEVATKAVTPDRAAKVEATRAKVDNRVATPDRASICTLTGTAGSTVECELKLATDANGDAARALQGTLIYDSNIATFNGFVDRVCPTADNCVDKAITAASPNLAATGHIVTTSPKEASEWNGKGSFILANLTNPQAAISTAKLGDADSGIFRARFTLKQDVTAANPFTVDIENVVAADAAANQLSIRIADHAIVTGAKVN